MFNRLDFLEFFDTEEITDEETGAVRYSVVSGNDLFAFSIWPLYKQVFLTLSKKNRSYYVYDVVLNDVKTIEVERRGSSDVRIIIFDNNGQCIATVMMKPEISLQCSVGSRADDSH